jgi:transcriptional regulator with GAF, ATPase, and Fis domain
LILPVIYDNNIISKLTQSPRERLFYNLKIRYNFNQSEYFSRGIPEIKINSVFATIRDINEVLALSNEPQKLLNMALDTLTQVLKTECCWVQTISARKRTLALAAQRGFSQEMKAELTSLDINHRFSEQIIGLGNEIVIPDLANDGVYGFSSFRKAGFKWLVAAPLMTYRVHGVLGIASRNKKRLYKETADLTKVIAGLIGTALNQAWLAQKPSAPAKTPEAAEKNPKRVTPSPEKTTSPTGQSAPPQAAPEKEAPPPLQEGAFRKHASKMKSFRSSHG